ncbi:uncharacterized protein LOC132295022 [Cornus florida]|uniref:uncharacterized protein LOC132295022 n=1 Tax=Cornus florida TaxID=4283 RepID=UPI0028A1ED73|nr:uncharacterized protein LOC132295022 [Cornus florida]
MDNLTHTMKTWTGRNSRVFDQNKLRNKFKQLRERYECFKKFLSNTGSSWDPTSGQVTLTEAQWKEMYKQIRDARWYRQKGCKHYNLLGYLFGDTSANGARSHPSTRSPPLTRLNDDGQEDNGQELPPVDTEVEGSFRARSRSPYRQRKTRESFQHRICNIMSEYSEHSKRKAHAIEKASDYNVHESKSCAVKVDEEAESLDAFLAVLDGMEGIDDDRYYKALNKFCEDPRCKYSRWVKIFLRLNEERRWGWLLNM